MRVKLLSTVPGGLLVTLMCWRLFGGFEAFVCYGAWIALAATTSIVIGQLAERPFNKQPKSSGRLDFLARFAGWYIDLFERRKRG